MLFLETFIVSLPHQIKQIKPSKINIVNAISTYVFYKTKTKILFIFPFNCAELEIATRDKRLKAVQNK